jgi:hypothetical protein
MMRNIIATSALVLCAFAHAVSAAPAVSYTVTVMRSGETEVTRSYTALASGERLRLTHEDAPPGEGVMYDTLIRINPSSVIAMNSRNRTWYRAPDASPFALTSGYLSPRPEGDIKKLSVTMETDSEIDGERLYSGEIRYDVVSSYGGETVKVSCFGTFTLTTTDKLPRQQWLGRILPTTRYPEVDEKIRAAEARIEGFPTKLSLEVQRTYEGGKPMTDSVEVTVSDIREITANELEFTRPPTYRMQEPVLGVPGVTQQ